MATKLLLKSSTNIVLNPVVHSFLEFLPLNRIEFVDRIQNEVESNPMLDLESADAPAEKDTSQENDFERKFERADSSFLSKYEENGFFKRDDSKIDKNRAIELFTASKTTLSDHLMNQAISELDKDEVEIAKHIIYNLNKDGYLEVAIESIASSMNTTPEEIERIRNQIKNFDPVGVASRDLKECLMAQVDDNEENRYLRVLINDHLENLSKARYSDIMDTLGLQNDELGELIAKLRRLNPKPGAGFEKEDIDFAGVDLMLIKEGNEYQIKYIEEGMPRLLLSQYYEQMFHKTQDKKTKSYLKEKYRNAQLFIDGIELRKSMIVKIAEYLVKFQKDYLDFGEKWKKPLTMKTVARDLNYSESTISRAVNNKFIASENGIIELKSFFTYGIKGEFGFTHSVETIKDKIKNIIADEPKEKPLSDQEIAEKLTNLGIKISRRTIRNYRDEMNILSSSRRKQEYKLNGT